jgi:hypothetical protein
MVGRLHPSQAKFFAISVEHYSSVLGECGVKYSADLPEWRWGRKLF